MIQLFLVCPKEQELHNIETKTGRKYVLFINKKENKNIGVRLLMSTTQTAIFVATHIRNINGYK